MQTTESSLTYSNNENAVLTSGVKEAAQGNVTDMLDMRTAYSSRTNHDHLRCLTVGALLVTRVQCELSSAVKLGGG